jgi:hypothetical protein
MARKTLKSITACKSEDSHSPTYSIKFLVTRVHDEGNPAERPEQAEEDDKENPRLRLQSTTTRDTSLPGLRDNLDRLPRNILRLHDLGLLDTILRLYDLGLLDTILALHDLGLLDTMLALHDLGLLDILGLLDNTWLCLNRHCGLSLNHLGLGLAGTRGGRNHQRGTAYGQTNRGERTGISWRGGK